MMDLVQKGSASKAVETRLVKALQRLEKLPDVSQVGAGQAHVASRHLHAPLPFRMSMQHLIADSEHHLPVAPPFAILCS